MKYTMIPVSHDTRTRVKRLLYGGESYDEGLNRILDLLDNIKESDDIDEQATD